MKRWMSKKKEWNDLSPHKRAHPHNAKMWTIDPPLDSSSAWRWKQSVKKTKKIYILCVSTPTTTALTKHTQEMVSMKTYEQTKRTQQ